MEIPLLHRRFKLPKGCSISSIVIRETNGIDEIEAAMSADNLGEKTSILSELVKLAIVEVDGEKVQQPFAELSHYNSKTRALIMRGYEQLNDLPPEELSVFLASSEDVTPGLKAVPKSQAEMAAEAASKETATR